jgi:hypothetical protein
MHASKSSCKHVSPIGKAVPWVTAMRPALAFWLQSRPLAWRKSFRARQSFRPRQSPCARASALVAALVQVMRNYIGARMLIKLRKRSVQFIEQETGSRVLEYQPP